MMKRILILFGLMVACPLYGAEINSDNGSSGGGVSSWNDLLDIPAGFADDTDDTGAGGGNFNNLPSTGIIPGPITLTSGTVTGTLRVSSGNFANMHGTGTLTYTIIKGSGSEIHNLLPANIVAGSLGNSVIASSVAADKIEAQNLKATNDPVDGQMPVYDGGSGGVTWTNQPSAGAGGLPLAEGASNYVKNSTSPFSDNYLENDGFRASTGVWTSSFTAIDQRSGTGNGIGLITSPSLAILYSSPITGGMIIMSTNPTDAHLGKMSIVRPDCVNGVCGPLSILTTNYLQGRISQTFTSSATAITAFSTMALYGLPHHLQTDTTGVFEIREFYAPSGSSSGWDPILNSVLAESTGIHPNPMYLNMAIATYTARSITGSDANSMVWNSTVAVTLSSATAGVASMQKGGLQNTVLTNWKTQIADAVASGRPFFVKFWFWATHGQSTRVIRDVKIAVGHQS